MSKYITGFDIGTASIKTAVAEIDKNNSLNIISLSRHSSQGVKKGVIHYLNDVQATSNIALEKVKSVARPALKNIYINVGGNRSRMQLSRGMVVVSRGDNEIYQDDIDRVVKSAQDMVRASNRVVIHTINKEFIVDGLQQIENPMGLTGNKLEVDSYVIDAFSPDVRNLSRVVEQSGGVINGMFYNPISTAQAILTKNQKDLGVTLIDIGSGTTSISVFEDGKLLHANVLPIGSSNITNDIAIGLKVSIEAAESLKLSYGYAVARDIPLKEKLDISKVDNKAGKPIARRFFSDIIEVRLAEIFELVNKELKNIGREKDLPAGVVLTGGGSKMPGIVELARVELKLPVQLGIVPTSSIKALNKEIEEKMEDPEYANAIGLILGGYSHGGHNRLQLTNPFSKFLNYFLP
ncbi:MAG: cell division protein FtsA [Candidatus Liptonbacteria bacterium CG11_big_fil_rev_8_21_14_0_20_35_14]|uniref:Cell division protein FtsA n=1 Tax=Candidatus Liptonbacteria bacterium CG11_big_fil_rev_8_21_14_0_20_35_14 TaxID=1974634 RepID=A0A2H0NAW1_9BACT|nr:MAG: cell division protein FtsA [Candidatus Liptonbacteria bacterium CG11_big_fil_rev_8_21_14_0_20_35_14]